MVCPGKALVMAFTISWEQSSSPTLTVERIEIEARTLTLACDDAFDLDLDRSESQIRGGVGARRIVGDG